MIILTHPQARGAVIALAFSPDGQTLASAARKDRFLRLWELQQRALRCSVQGHDKGAATLAFAPDGEVLASAGAGRIRLWVVAGDPAVLQRDLAIDPPGAIPIRLAFSPDGRTLATNGNSRDDPRPWPYHRDVALIDTTTYRARYIETHHSPGVTCLAISPDGRTLATGAFDRKIRLWRLGELSMANELNFGQKVHHLTFSPDGRQLAGASMQGLVKLYDTQTGRKITTLKGQAAPLHAMCYSPDSRFIATAGGEGTVGFWNVATMTCQSRFDWGIGTVHAVAFAPDGMRAAAGGSGQIVVWDIDDWE